MTNSPKMRLGALLLPLLFFFGDASEGELCGLDALYLRAVEEGTLSEETQAPADVGTYRNALSAAVELDDGGATEFLIDRLARVHGRGSTDLCGILWREHLIAMAATKRRADSRLKSSLLSQCSDFLAQ